MNTKQHDQQKGRGSRDITYLGKTVDEMVWQFMESENIDGLTLTIVQAPYIPRAVSYGFSDKKQKRLASVHTMWPIGPISQAYLAVAVMQLHELGMLDVYAPLSSCLDDLPVEWKDVRILDALRHASGVQNFRTLDTWNPNIEFSYQDVITRCSHELQFLPGTAVALSPANSILLSEIVERVSGITYDAFVRKHQISCLGIQHTCFVHNLQEYPHEDVALSENLHQLFKKDPSYIDPVEPAASYDAQDTEITFAPIRGYNDIWASAQDISFWDIALAGSVLIHDSNNRNLIYSPWQLPDGKEIPAVTGWQFYKHRGLMDIKGSVPGFSSFLSRFTDASELVCVTLLANKEGVDFTNLGRRIAGAFGDLLSTNYDDNRLYLMEGAWPAEETIARLEAELKRRRIPLFAKFDHKKNAEEVGLALRTTTVLVFGSPVVGTKLMQVDQSISVELPLKISIWEDEAGSTWLAYPRIRELNAAYNLDQHPVSGKMEILMADLVRTAADVYVS